VGEYSKGARKSAFILLTLFLAAIAVIIVVTVQYQGTNLVRKSIGNINNNHCIDSSSHMVPFDVIPESEIGVAVIYSMKELGGVWKSLGISYFKREPLFSSLLVLIDGNCEVRVFFFDTPIDKSAIYWLSEYASAYEEIKEEKHTVFLPKEENLPILLLDKNYYMALLCTLPKGQKTHSHSQIEYLIKLADFISHKKRPTKSFVDKQLNTVVLRHLWCLEKNYILINVLDFTDLMKIIGVWEDFSKTHVGKNYVVAYGLTKDKLRLVVCGDGPSSEKLEILSSQTALADVNITEDNICVIVSKKLEREDFYSFVVAPFFQQPENAGGGI